MFSPYFFAFHILTFPYTRHCLYLLIYLFIPSKDRLEENISMNVLYLLSVYDHLVAFDQIQNRYLSLYI